MTSPEELLLSIVVPCFNEEEVISETISQLNSLGNELINEGLCGSFEIIFINDGSRDKTEKIIENEIKASPHIRLIQFSRNYGHQPALLAGYSNASGDVIVSLDADLQDPPEVIRDFLKKYFEGYDIVYGVRNDRQNDTFFKKFTAGFFYAFMRILGVDIVPDHADFRLVSRRAMESFLKLSESNLFIRAAFPLVGYPSANVFYKRSARFAGSTKYPFMKMLDFALNGITSFSVVPLRLCALTGLLFFIISLVLIIWSLTVNILGLVVPGWTSTVAPLYLLGGLQMIFLGIMGEYIGKIYIEVKGRPKYVIQELKNFPSNHVKR